MPCQRVLTPVTGTGPPQPAETAAARVLDRVLVLGEAHPAQHPGRVPGTLRHGRPHQGIAQRIPHSEHDGALAVADLGRERIHRKPVLGGLINGYSRAA
jgi:putative transposase